MSTDPEAAPRRLPERPNLRHLKDQAKDLRQNRRGGIDYRCAVPDRAAVRVCELAKAQGTCRVLRRSRSTQAGYRHQRHCSCQER